MLVEPAVQAAIAALNEMNLVLDSYMLFPQLQEVIETARTHPRLTIVLNHCGGPLGYGAYLDNQAEHYTTLRRGIDREGDGVIEAGLSDPGQAAQALDQALRKGPITRLVNNAGIIRPGPVEEQSQDDLDAAVSLNLRCALQCLKALLPGMKDAGFGRVANMSSRTAIGKEPGAWASRRTWRKPSRSSWMGEAGS